MMKEKVSAILERLDLTPDDLAKRLGVKRAVVINWLTGRVRESPQSVLLDNALNALEEGLGKDFVLDYVLKDGPISFREIIKQVESRIQSAKPSDTPAMEASEGDDGLLSDMEQASLEAYTKGHYIQSGLILFQAIETLMRILIKTHGQKHKVKESALTEAADKEQSFLRLTLHLDLVYTDNELSDDLRRLNRRRNDTMHRLFYEFESRQEMESKLREFCLEAKNLRDRLAKEVHEDLAGLLSPRMD